MRHTQHARILSILIGGLVATTAASAALAGLNTRATLPVPDLDEIRELAAMASGPEGLAQSAAIAIAATRLQADDLGGALAPSLVAHPTPLSAVAALAAGHGVAMTPAASASLAALDGPVAVALTNVVDAFLAMEMANAAAFARADRAALDALAGAHPSGLELASAQDVLGLDLAPVLVARVGLIEAVLDLREALFLEVRDELPTVDLAPALVIRGSEECVDNVYPEDIVLLIDVCGNDVYTNNAGGGFAMAAALVDYGGDDRYGETSFDLLEGGRNGGGNFGTGFLIDESGNDVYIGPDDGVNGGAFAGVGFLLDSAGDDVYDTGRYGWGTNGGGYWAGVALLVDREGNDVYRGTSSAVNGGSEGGIGFLYDGAGNDVYQATSGGTNGGSATGRGRLIDVSGDDLYVAKSIGANGGAVGGQGMLWDGAGHDLYDDDEGGSGWDVTLFPKGAAGAQMDE